jgi:capsular exopolysaccharide synthesis family protein
MGVMAAFLFEILDKRVKDEDEILTRHNVPVLGLIPLIKVKNKVLPVISDKTEFSVAEAYKAARTNLFFAVQNQKGSRLIVTSAAPNEGKSTSCCNIAITLSQMHLRVLILDCDLRKPVIHKFFDKPCVPGLSEYLAGIKDDISEVVQNTEHAGLNIICGGTVPPNPAELLGSHKMNLLLCLLSKEYDYILLDTPPANLVADALALSALTDGVLLVVRQGKTEHPELSHALASLKFANAKVLGVMMNGIGPDRYGKMYGSKRHKKYYQGYKQA